jgi:hypothetical protein
MVGDALPLVFDVESEGIEKCAHTFARDNGIPYDKLDLDVFRALASINTVEDAIRSPLFLPSAKTAFLKCLKNTRGAHCTRIVSTQGITQHLVHPTAEELGDPYARIACPDTDFKTMADHPFFSVCVSLKMLSFFVSPSGGMHFHCDLLDHTPPDVRKEFCKVRSMLSEKRERHETEVTLDELYA